MIVRKCKSLSLHELPRNHVEVWGRGGGGGGGGGGRCLPHTWSWLPVGLLEIVLCLFCILEIFDMYTIEVYVCLKSIATIGGFRKALSLVGKAINYHNYYNIWLRKR